MVKLNTIEQSRETSIKDKNIKKRKISLPPLMSVSMIKKRCSQKKKTEAQSKVKINMNFSDEDMLDHRMYELINKIQELK